MLPRPMPNVEQVKVKDAAAVAIVGDQTLPETVVSPVRPLEQMSHTLRFPLHGGAPQSPLNKLGAIYKVLTMINSRMLVTPKETIIRETPSDW